MHIVRRIYLGLACIGLMAVLLYALNLFWPTWTIIDPTTAWEHVARAAVNDNERYVIEDDEGVRATGLSRIMIFRSAWDVLKTCPDEVLIEPPVSVKTISQEDTDSMIVQIDCVTAQLKCYVMTRNRSSSLFAIDYCGIIDEGRSD
jgi:hypothetical protein